MAIEQSTRIDWLDYGRFGSAIAVMIYHYAYFSLPGGGAPSEFGAFSLFAKYCYLGVDFFFIISGFVICYSAEARSADRFAGSRVVRLFPAFLFCMTLTALVRLARGDELSIGMYLANLTMLPEAFRTEAMDGVYWSLALEIAFYAVVFFIVLLRAAPRLEWILWAWVTLQIILYPFEIPMLSGYFSLFAAGGIISFIYRKGYSAPRVLFLIAAALLAAANAYFSPLPGSPVITVPLTLGLIAVFLVLKRPRTIPGARMVGAITYPLYLLHAEIGYTLRPLFSSGWAWLAVTVPLMLVLAWCVSEFVERRNARFWQWLADRAVGAPIRAGLSWTGLNVGRSTTVERVKGIEPSS